MDRALARVLGSSVVVAALLAMPSAASAQRTSLRCDPVDTAACLLPWPNNYFTKRDRANDTGRELALTNAMMPRSARNKGNKPIDASPYNRNDGFSPGNVLITRVPGLDSTRALRRSGAVLVTDLRDAFAKDAPIIVINARTRKRHLIFAEIDSQAPRRADRNLLIRPAVNFEEGERYIVVLRNLENARGRELQPSRAFRALRDGVETRNRAIERRRPSMERIFRTLERAKIDRDDLYLAWDFTVASEDNLSERALAMRNDAFAQLGDRNLADRRVEGSSPSFTIGQVTNFTPCGSDGCQAGENDDIVRRVEGTLNVPCYLNRPGCAPGAQINFASRTSNRPVQQAGNVAQPEFICNIPYAAVAQPGRPLMVGHGLLGDRLQVNSFAAPANQFNFVSCAVDWAGMSRGDLGSVAQILFDLSLFPAIPDRLQQGFLNFNYLGRAMMHPSGFGANPAFRFGNRSVIDTSTQLYFNGNSQGGILGGALTALAPDFERSVLGVPGMNYGLLVERSIDFDQYARVLYQTYPDYLERPLIVSLMQLLWDRGDANGYGHHITDDPLAGTPSHKTLLVEAFGDHQVANVATEMMARTIGARLRKPALDAGRHPDRRPYYRLPGIPRFPFDGSALVVVDSGPVRTVGGSTVGTAKPPVGNTPPRVGKDPHGSPRNSPQILQLISDFLKADGMVTNTCGARPCYADGFTGSP
jgi:hypothetical protein